MKSVFISSTKTDLLLYRAAVDAAIRRLELRPINMDDFGSQPGGAANTSIREVDKADIFIGILAHRYGYVPAGMDRSVTEQEYDRAVERNMPRLLYLVDPAYTWPDEFIEKDDPAADYSAQAKLNAFKAKVNKAEVRSLFTTPDDLAQQVTIDLVKLLAEDRRQQRLFRVLAAVVIIIVALVAAFMTFPQVKNPIVEFVGLASATFTPSPPPTLTFTPSATFTPSPTPTATATPLEGTPFAQGDVGVVFANFHKNDPDAPNTDDNIRRELQKANVPFIQVHHELSGRDEAQQIAKLYHATIVIWGEISGSVRANSGLAALNFYINAPPTQVATSIDGFEVSAAQLTDFDVYVAQGMDTLYVVDFIRGQVAYFGGDKTTALTDFNDAVEHISAGREKDVQAQALYFYRGYIYELQENYSAALADYTQAIQLDPNYGYAYNNRGNIYSYQQQYDLALADFNKVLQLNPNFAAAYYNRGIVYTEQKQYDRALADFSHALQLVPNLADAYYNRGIVYTDQKQYDLALADFSHALQLDPNLAVAYTNRGLIYYGRQQYDRALADYNHALQLDPNLAVAYSIRGLIYSDQKQYEQALTDYNEALQLDPNLAIAYASRGATYLNMMQGKSDPAKQTELAQKAVADLRHAQALGLTFSPDQEKDLEQFEGQYGTPEATESPAS